MGLGKPGRLRVDQLTITGELGPVPDAYTHYSIPLRGLQLCRRLQGGALLMKAGLFFCAKQEAVATQGRPRHDLWTKLR